jgi:hypothetical protein
MLREKRIPGNVWYFWAILVLLKAFGEEVEIDLSTLRTKLSHGRKHPVAERLAKRRANPQSNRRSNVSRDNDDCLARHPLSIFWAESNDKPGLASRLLGGVTWSGVSW